MAEDNCYPGKYRQSEKVGDRKIRNPHDSGKKS